VHVSAISRRIADVHHADQADPAIAALVAIGERDTGGPKSTKPWVSWIEVATATAVAGAAAVSGVARSEHGECLQARGPPEVPPSNHRATIAQRAHDRERERDRRLDRAPGRRTAAARPTAPAARRRV
jgi:hypothetical protein